MQQVREREWEKVDVLQREKVDVEEKLADLQRSVAGVNSSHQRSSLIKSVRLHSEAERDKLKIIEKSEDQLRELHVQKVCRVHKHTCARSPPTPPSNYLSLTLPPTPPQSASDTELVSVRARLEERNGQYQAVQVVSAVDGERDGWVGEWVSGKVCVCMERWWVSETVGGWVSR